MSHKPWYPVKIDPTVQRMAKPKFLLPHLNTEKLMAGCRNPARGFLALPGAWRKDLVRALVPA